MRLVVFSEDIEFAHHFVTSHLPLPYRSGIGYTSKSYLKWWVIQLAIHPIVGK